MTTLRVERRADQLRKGDRLDIRGRLWTVEKAKRQGKKVRLVVAQGRQEYADEVKAKTRYTVVLAAADSSKKGRPTREGASGPSSTGKGPLLDDRGAMRRWATKDEARDLEPPAKTPMHLASPWPDIVGEDADLIEELGARLIGVEVEGGKLLVPPVTDSTILGHLLTMHGRRFDGATMAEAKAWAREHDPGGSSTARGVLDALTMAKAYALHDELHKDLTAMPTPHWHREKAPR